MTKEAHLSFQTPKLRLLRFFSPVHSLKCSDFSGTETAPRQVFFQMRGSLFNKDINEYCESHPRLTKHFPSQIKFI